MTINSARHWKVKKWKELYVGADRNSEYFATENIRMLNYATERGLLTEFVIRERTRPRNLFDQMDRIWVSEEVAEEIGMRKNWFAVIKKPKLSIESFDRILLLDNFQEAGDLGTIIRTANCFGFDGIMLTGGSINPWTRTVSTSAHFHALEVPIISLPFADAIRMLRDHHVSLVTVGRRKAVPVEQIPFGDRMAILLPGSGASSQSLMAVSDTVCDPDLDCGDPDIMVYAATIMMYACSKKGGD